MTSSEFRRAHFNRLVIQAGGVTKLAQRLEVTQGYVSNVKSGRNNLGEKAARKIESKMGLPHGAMDRPPAGGVLPPTGATRTQSPKLKGTPGLGRSDRDIDTVFCYAGWGCLVAVALLWLGGAI